MATLNIELTPSLQSGDYYLIQLCTQSQHHLSCTMSSRINKSASQCLLEVFPLEILGRIYIYCKNPSFAMVNKTISQCLSSQTVRIEFCIRVFFHGDHPSPYADNETFKLLKRARNLVLRQPWFSNNFARELQREVLRRQKVRAGTADPLTYYRSDRVQAQYLTLIPKELLLQKPWGPAKVKLIHRLLQWGAMIPSRPKHAARSAIMNAIIENNYLAVNLLHNYCKVRFHHEHFQAAVLGDCEKRIVEMIIGYNNRQRQPFINPFDAHIAKKAKLMDQAGNPMGRQLLRDVLWKGFERDFAVASR